MGSTNDLAKGVAIKKDGKMFFVMESFFVSPGKGAAFYRTKLREIKTNKVVEHTFKSGETIDLLETERKTASFLYKKGDTFFFMDQENYEQYEIPEEILPERLILFLKEGLDVIILFAEGEIIDANLVKTKIPYKVVDAPPALKGDSVSNSYRPITIETGAKVSVPLFIKEGENIVINTETGEYAGREKGE